MEVSSLQNKPFSLLPGSLALGANALGANAGRQRASTEQSAAEPPPEQTGDEAVAFDISTNSREDSLTSAQVHSRAEETELVSEASGVARVSDANHAELAEYSPEFARQYLDLADKAGGGDGRVENFVKSVANLLASLGEPGAETAAGASLGGDVPLRIGGSVSFSLAGHLDAAFAASVNGEGRAIEVGVEHELGFEAAVHSSLAGKDLNQFDFAESGGQVDGKGLYAPSHPPFFNRPGGNADPAEATLGLKRVGFPELGLFDENQDGQFDAQDVVHHNTVEKKGISRTLPYQPKDDANVGTPSYSEVLKVSLSLDA